MKLKGSIQFKYLGAAFSVLLVTFVAGTLLIARNEQALLQETLLGKGKSLANYIANLCVDPILMNDVVRMDNIVKEINTDPDVAYAAVADKGGGLLTSFYASFNEKPEMKNLLAALPKDSSDVRMAMDAIDKGGFVRHLTVPVKVDQDLIGTVHLGVSLAWVKAQTRRTALFILGVNLVVTLLLGISLFSLSRILILTPIGKILAVSKRVASGDLLQKVEVDTTDEIGDLARGFNQLVENLRLMMGRVRNAAGGVGKVSRDIEALARQVSSGAQTQARSVDEASSSVEEMNAIIKEMVTSVENLSTSAEESTSSILEMSASIDQVAGNAENLSAAVEETSSLIQEMTTSIAQVAGNVSTLSSKVSESSAALVQIDSSIRSIEKTALDTNVLSEDVTRSVTGEGQETVKRAVEGMSRIRQTVLQSASTIRRLGEKSQDIGAILDVINDITDQINLLALNAAIIAAQAGTHGRAFAVVADEVRGLAERTTSSTKEISAMIKGVQGEIGVAMAAMDQGQTEAETGVKLIEDVEATLRKVSLNSQKASEASKIIARTTSEQTVGSKQISNSAEKMAQMAAEISRATGEQAKGTEQIMRAVVGMKEMAAQVKQAAIEQSKGTKLITAASEKATSMSQNILGAVKEEAKGSEMILRSIENVNGVAKVNITVVDQLDALIKALNTEALALRQEIERFKVGESA